METLPTENTEVKYAGFWLRFVAYLIDELLMSIIGFVVSLPFIGGIVFSAIGISKNPDEAQNIAAGVMGILGSILGMILVIAAIGWLYFALMESSKNQATLGKMALGLKVTDMDGNKISFGRATGRYFGKFLSGLILSIGYIIAGFTEKKQALHDMIASCLVLRK